MVVPKENSREIQTSRTRNSVETEKNKNKTGCIEMYTTTVRRPKISVGTHSCEISKFRENMKTKFLIILLGFQAF
jgi:hypothetical protein